MRLATRLWLLGALVPMAGILLALLLAESFFQSWLAREVDRALLTQAAVEAVSLFDGPGGKPHLHMRHSPLEQEVRPFAPMAELFGPTGQRLVVYPSSAEAPPGQRPRRTHRESRLASRRRRARMERGSGSSPWESRRRPARCTRCGCRRRWRSRTRR